MEPCYVEVGRRLVGARGRRLPVRFLFLPIFRYSSGRLAIQSRRAYGRNIRASVWNYRLGGDQVLKKWLFCREIKVLGRPLLSEEVQHFTDTARRSSAILLLARVDQR